MQIHTSRWISYIALAFHLFLWGQLGDNSLWFPYVPSCLLSQGYIYCRGYLPLEQKLVRFAAAFFNFWDSKAQVFSVALLIIAYVAPSWTDLHSLCSLVVAKGSSHAHEPHTLWRAWSLREPSANLHECLEDWPCTFTTCSHLRTFTFLDKV
jgi:hypothetical protein